MNYDYCWRTIPDATQPTTNSPGPSSFHINNSGGRALAEIMEELRMVFWSPDQAPFAGLPDPRDFDVPTDWWFNEEYLDRPRTSNEIAFHRVHDEALSWHGSTTPGIPGHKIAGTNDGWIVTPAEIRAALAILDSTPPEDIRNAIVAILKCDDKSDEFQDWTESFSEWLDFLRGAAAYGDGFTTR